MKWQRTQSTPSMEVPELSPRTRRDRGAIVEDVLRGIGIKVWKEL